MPRKSALLFSLLLAAAPVHAEDHPLRLPATVFLIAAEADSISTFYGQRAYDLREVNPMYASMSPEMNFTLGHAVDLGTVYLATKIGKRHPKLAALGLYVMAIMRAEMVRQNLNNIRTMKDRRAQREQRRVTIPIVVINLGSGEGR